ncbi:PH domain-containing protein [Arthrobacter sp. Sa2CUA1]|uniref:PH domain-containing protein n=1 Tax=Arthrobacter gallicola TaxID=2762225 RepID=A0ABR8URW4_9MICC|nr:PH domain-containing protein [Arthrobacter gallicola]MBD7995278.1 PH domain-containing protein [Arthrobacter gallicola]
MSIPMSKPEPAVFRPRSTLWFTGIAGLLALAAMVSAFLSSGFSGLLATAPLLLIPAVASWLFWYPCVRVDTDGVALQNPFRTIEVPWAALIHVDTRFALKLITPHGSYTAWAAPAPGVWGTHTGKPEHVRNLPGTTYGAGGSVRPGDLSHTDSGQAARLVRSRWEALVNAGGIDADQTDAATVRSTANWRWLLGLPGLAVALFALTGLA